MITLNKWPNLNNNFLLGKDKVDELSTSCVLDVHLQNIIYLHLILSIY